MGCLRADAREPPRALSAGGRRARVSDVVGEQHGALSPQRLLRADARRRDPLGRSDAGDSVAAAAVDAVGAGQALGIPEPMTAIRVLVTGASGFVGRRSLDPLLARGAEVHTAQRHEPPTIPGVVSHAVDLHDRAAVESLMRRVRPTHLLHFAWIATPGVYLTSLDNPVWLRSSLQLVEAFLANGGSRVVVAGTVAEYDWSAGVCSERTTPCRPATLYAACKHAQYEVLERWSVQEGFSFAEGRLFWTYGPEESPERLVPGMIHTSLSRMPFQLRYPAQVRDYLHVADVGAAFR